MKLVVQRVKEASVEIDNRIVSKIDKGLLIYLGIHHDDNIETVKKLAKKVANLRIFEDENNKMNLSNQDILGSYLLVSQFTLYANTKRGNRPSFIDAAKPDLAIPLYEMFIEELSKYGEVKTGEFGADMKISSINDGPVTIIIEE